VGKIKSTTYYTGDGKGKNFHANHLHICFPSDEEMDRASLSAEKGKILARSRKTKKDRERLELIDRMLERQSRLTQSCASNI